LITCSDNLDAGWACGGVAHSFFTTMKWLSEPKKCHQECLMSSAQSLHGPCLQSIVHSLTCGYSRNVPLLHTFTQCQGTSLHVISFSRPSPALVMQAMTTGSRRPGYEARLININELTLSTHFMLRAGFADAHCILLLWQPPDILVSPCAALFVLISASKF